MDKRLIYLLINNGSAEQIKNLIDHGVDPKTLIEGRNAIHLAVQYGGNVDVVKLLIDHGVDLSHRDDNNMTPLELARIPIFFGADNSDVVEFLEAVK